MSAEAGDQNIDSLMEHAPALYGFAFARLAGVTEGSAAVLPTRARQKLRLFLLESLN